MRTILFAVALLPFSASATAFPSLSCVFTEPFVGIDVWPGGARAITPEKTLLLRNRKLGGSALEPTVQGTIAGMPAQLAIINKPGSDGMSDFERPLTGTLTGWPSTATLQGACLRYPDGTTPRDVIGIAPTSKLIVRSTSAGAGSIVGRIGPRGRFWAYPDPLVKGRARGAFERLPTGGTGSIVVAEGWVHARFLKIP